MIIAVTYDNGMINQHFGKTQYMKIYETDESGEIQKVHLESMGKHSHHGIAGYIKEIGVDTLICGGLGQGAVDSLEAAGITIYAGNTGNCDSAVIKFLHGEMKQNSQANCDHHHHHHDS
ncbi:NifB/NifX family molybdenum-iron cluster-binding protein [Eubacterium coprostanoligenes]|uniref:NifB/NifX family molybdenum-iron cluster-binding protein n=1 Tax=Eubacterium coprostanoligenes TaxID=290054 RepID=UPI002A8172F4|nr:NifB/NifX family molybdenum-iron cluster-binding protein [Eubacterium coprostanoligenes]MDY4699313.1 NifB/NifX family molybdenum-iron cluster-binding protein [Eubacterium coprostanoligenes]